MPEVGRVDISALFGPPGPARDRCDKDLWEGLRDTGSVVITGYPGADEVDLRARTGLAVFDLPTEIKRDLTTRLEVPENPNWYRGYWPCTPNRTLKNDFFDVGPAEPCQGPDLPGIEILTEPTPWPDPEPKPGWTDTVRAHYDHSNGVALAMILSIGRSAGFDDDAIHARFDGANSTLRFLEYSANSGPPMKAPDGTMISGGRHTDASGLSLLWQDRPGLQAEGKDGVFRDIPIVPNAISVHVGDVMTTLTRGVVPATPHRVVAQDGPRRSVGFFLEPALSAAVTPADYEGETRVEDTYGWLLLSTFAKRDFWRGVIRDPKAA